MCLPENKRMEKRGREIYEDIIPEKFPSYEENQHTDSRSSVNSNRPNMVKQKQTIQKKKKKKKRGRMEGRKANPGSYTQEKFPPRVRMKINPFSSK